MGRVRSFLSVAPDAERRSNRDGDPERNGRPQVGGVGNRSRILRLGGIRPSAAAHLSRVPKNISNEGQRIMRHELKETSKAWTIRVVVWAGTVQREFFTATHVGAMAIVDRHHRNAYDPKFYDRDGTQLHDLGCTLVAEKTE